MNIIPPEDSELKQIRDALEDLRGGINVCAVVLISILVVLIIEVIRRA